MGAINNHEINRKILHILFAIVPVTLAFLDNKYCIFFIILFAVTTISLDIIVKKFASLKIKQIVYRNNEILSHKKFTGAFWIAFTCILVVLLFNKNQYIPAMLAVAFCDTFASLVGQKYGKYKLFSSKKTFEGFAGFLLGGIPVFMVSSLVGVRLDIFAFIMALFISALFELIDKIDDNFSVMMMFAIVLCLLK